MSEESRWQQGWVALGCTFILVSDYLDNQLLSLLRLRLRLRFWAHIPSHLDTLSLRLARDFWLCIWRLQLSPKG